MSSPVVLLIALSAVGHLRKPAYVGAAGSPEYDRQVLAYRDRVVAVAEIVHHKEAEKQRFLPVEAGKWVAGYRSGTLLPLRPAAYEDHLRDGVRGEVLYSGLRLGTQVAFRANQALEHGKYAEAASDSVLAAETVLGLREFELQAFLQCVSSARRALSIAETAWPHLSPRQRETLRPRIQSLRVDDGETQSLLRLEDHLLKDYLNRQGRKSTQPQIDVEALAKADDQQRKIAEKGTQYLNKAIESLIGPPSETSSQPE